MTDLEQLNRDWLSAWAAQDAERLAAFYAADCRFFDARVPGGLEGRDALLARFGKLFELAPPMDYEPDRIWPVESGFCSRYRCTIRAGDIRQQLRGLALVLLRDGLIVHNELYTHPLPDEPSHSA